jgi:hypothetical protein
MKIKNRTNNIIKKKLLTTKLLVPIKAVVANGFSTQASSIRGIKEGTTYAITTHTAQIKNNIIIRGYVKEVLIFDFNSCNFLNSVAIEERESKSVQDFSQASTIELSD